MSGGVILRFTLVMISALAAFLMAGCAADPSSVIIGGVERIVPIELNVPTESAVSPDVRVQVTHSTLAEMQNVGCSGSGVVGCTYYNKDERLCRVWLIDPSEVPGWFYRRVWRHEVLGHCNGHRHIRIKADDGRLLVLWL